MSDLVIPASLRPEDGRFGSGPANIRPGQLAALASSGRTYLGTSHRQPPVRSLVHRVRAGLAELFGLPGDYTVVLGNGGTSAFWDAAAFGLVRRHSQHLSFGEFRPGSPHRRAGPGRRADRGVCSRDAPGAVARARGGCVRADSQRDLDRRGDAGAPRARRRPGALVLVDATSAAAGLAVRAAEFDAYYFAPQKGLGSDGGLWIALMSPAAVERVGEIASSGRYIPDFLSLRVALENAALDQTYNTPAVATLFLLADQVEWMLGQGGLEWATARPRDRLPYCIRGRRRQPTRIRSSPIPRNARRWSAPSTWPMGCPPTPSRRHCGRTESWIRSPIGS